MDKYRIEPNNHQEGDIFLSDVEISPLILFCSALFPGCEFKYCVTRNDKHQLYHFLDGEENENKGLFVAIDTNLLNFTVQECNNTSANPNKWLWNYEFLYHQFLQYRVVAAYQLLESIGAIEHHIVDPILKQPATLQLQEQ